ncbi:hypothetical protein ACIA8O_36050 [Kitasatospora sp. NPDC051853]|uniref:hypothetical protein n=1 Tax=Kitasatospora sp. NPDC051853 TaxID=3364058 RepID=UPI0037887039
MDAGYPGRWEADHRDGTREVLREAEPAAVPSGGFLGVELRDITFAGEQEAAALALTVLGVRPRLREYH